VIIGPCWRCEKPGHVAADCQPPPAKTIQELHQRIARLTERWDRGYGEVTTAQKRQWITAERRAYEKGKGK
jgi:hypothetical protein